MKKWFITGCGGFIGSNLCEYLLKSNQIIYGFDNLSTGSASNIKRLSTYKNFHFTDGDILDKHSLSNLIQDIDFVVHLAAQGSVQRSMDEPILNNDINVNGFLNVLTVSSQNGVEKFIYASSCSVYGDTDVLPIDESVPPIPLSPYASSKLINDYYASNLRDSLMPMKMYGLRFFNIFGPFQDPKGAYAAVIARWINDCINGIQPLVYGNGEQTRDFCYVENVSKLIYSISENNNNEGDIFNVSSNTSISLNNLFKIIHSKLSFHGIELPFDSPSYKEARPGDIIHSLGSNVKAIKELGFAPKINIEEGIELILRNQYNFG